MNLEQFKNWSLAQGSVGKYQDGSYKGECVSLINQYCWRVFNIPAGAWGNAVDWGSNATVLKYFDRVGSAQAGDILVYGGTAGNPYGHIEIYLGGNRSLFQNRSYNGRVGEGATLGGYFAILRSKSSPIVGGGNSSMAVVDDSIKTQLRIVNSEVKGWDRNEVHSGKFDDREINAWRGQSVQKLLQQAWEEGEWYRRLKDTWKAAFDEKGAKDKTISDLTAQVIEARTQKATSDSAVNDLTGKLEVAETARVAHEATIADLQKALEEERKKTGTPLDQDHPQMDYSKLNELITVVTNWFKNLGKK